MNQESLKYITYGMYLVGFNDSNHLGGCIINTLSQVTSTDMLFTINLNHNNYTNEAIKKTKRFSVSILKEDTSPSIIQTFGFKTSKETEKFKSIPYEMKENLPILKESCGYLIFEVKEIINCITHDIILAKLVSCDTKENENAMTYKYYHEVIKGRAPKNAPTYQEEKTTKESYVCDICGYIVEGEPPDDFICPICGANKSHFKKKEKNI